MTTTSFKGPEPFHPGNNNPSALWTEYRDSFKIYALAAKLSAETNEIQIATFLHIIGPAARRIYNTFNIQVPAQQSLTLNMVYAAFDQYYEPYKNLVAFRYTFFTTYQGTHQPFDEYITDLKTKARNCEFGTLHASLICTQIVCGVRKETLRKELLAIRNLTLDTAVTKCQADEASTNHANAISIPTEKSEPSPAALDSLRRRENRPLNYKGQQRTFNASANQRPMNTQDTRSQFRQTQQQSRSLATRAPHRSQNACRNCGTTHTQQGYCPARNDTCHGCSRRGHWISCCRSTQTHEITTDRFTNADSPYDGNLRARYDECNGYWQPNINNSQDFYCTELSLYCHDMNAPLAPAEEWLETIYFANFPVTMKLDTGSQVNMIHQGIYDKLPVKPQLHKPPFTVRAYSGHPIDIIGVAYIVCASFAVSTQQCFYITPHRTIPILGAQASVEMGLLTRNTKPSQQKTTMDNHMLETRRQAPFDKSHAAPKTEKDTETYNGPPWHLNAPRRANLQPQVQNTPLSMEDVDRMAPADIVQRYQDVFDRIGKLPGKYTISLKPNVTPTISAPRQVPLALQAGVRKELKRLQDLGIITPVSEPTEWVHPMVAVAKENGGTRICLDPRNLNAAIRKEPFPTPTAQEIFANLHGAEIFTVFDAQSAFWQVELDEESSLLCTFATPYGRFRFLRLALGICTSSSVFQRTMSTIYPPNEFPGTYISTDDFLLATTKRTHNRAIVAVLERARQAGLTFSSEKMQLAVEKITYLGMSITPKGLEIAPSKVQAIQAIPAPTERLALQRFLGMINFVARFLPQHSTEAAPLRALLKKGTTFLWDANADLTFKALKRLITTAPVLAFFNPKLPSVISVDSSGIGVGAVLMQANRPVEYASTSFTPTQQNYAPIERELLGIVYACERFQYYITGTTFTIETDHRPLVSVVRKPLHMLSPRLQRLVLKLTPYDVHVTYVPGAKLYVADTLSRAPRPEKDIDTSDLEGTCIVLHATTTLPEGKFILYGKATEQDDICQTLHWYIRNGWPTTTKKLHASLRPLWGIQEELHVRGNLIYRGERLYVPTALRREALQQIHVAHQGITACVARAKLYVYWPGITEDITSFVRQCPICQQRARANPRLPLHPYIIPQRPWEIVGTDIFHVGNKSIIMLVDYFSKYVEAQEK